MTPAEMHIEFKLKLDHMDKAELPDFEPEEIDILLNAAYDKFLYQRTPGFEETQKRMDDLDPLIVAANITSANILSSNANNKPNGRFVVLPDGTSAVIDPTASVSATPYPKYRHMVEEEATIVFVDPCTSTSTTARVEVVPITHDRYNKIIQNPFKKPNEKKVLRLSSGKPSSDSGKRVAELITMASAILQAYHIRYVKEPKKINSLSVASTSTSPAIPIQACELPEHTHREIVDIAVQLALENIQSERTRTFEIINKRDIT